MLELFYRELAYINIYGAISLKLVYRKFYNSTVKEILILRKTDRNVKKQIIRGWDHGSLPVQSVQYGRKNKKRSGKYSFT